MNTDNKISRRDALKHMGAAVISGTVASSGLLSLTIVREEKEQVPYLLFYRNG